MSSLWTPDGERRVPPAQPAAAGTGPGRGGGARGPGARASEGAGAGADEEALREVAAEILAAPVEDVVANHCYGLFELAALHLSQQQPDLRAARTAIDAMGLLVDGLADRLGQHAGSLKEGLAQLRLAFVGISDATERAARDSDGNAGPGPVAGSSAG